MYLAYTYYIRHKITGQYYYGYRCRNIKLKRTSEEDFWIKYFSSSKNIKKLIEDHGKESFEISILLKDKDWEKCYLLEQELIAEHLHEVLCLNEYCHSTGIFSVSGNIPSDKTKAKMSAARMGVPSPNKGKPAHNKGKTTPNEVKEKISAATSGIKNHNFGNTHSTETRARISIGRKDQPGHIQTEETREKLRLAKKGKSLGKKGPSATLLCPHCGIVGGIGAMKRWHFDNCPKRSLAAD